MVSTALLSDWWLRRDSFSELRQGSWTVSISTLPSQETIGEVLRSLETETTALFTYLDLGFLLEFPVFAPDPRGRKRVFESSELFRGLLHCFYNEIYAPQAMEQELANDDVRPVCGFDRRHRGVRSAGSSTTSLVSSKRRSPGFLGKCLSV